MQPELDDFNYILERQLKPEAREDVIQFLEENKIKPTSMIDVSDGLASKFYIFVNKVKLDANCMKKRFLLINKHIIRLWILI